MSLNELAGKLFQDVWPQVAKDIYDPNPVVYALAYAAFLGFKKGFWVGVQQDSNSPLLRDVENMVKTCSVCEKAGSCPLFPEEYEALYERMHPHWNYRWAYEFRLEEAETQIC